MYTEHKSASTGIKRGGSDGGGRGSKLSMYSTWRAAPYNPNPAGLSTKQLLDHYDSCSSKRRQQLSQRHDVISVASPANEPIELDVVHSSYWQDKEVDNDRGRDGRIGDVICSVKVTVAESKAELTVSNALNLPTISCAILQNNGFRF